MSNHRIFIPQLWEDNDSNTINIKEVTVKIITSNKYKYFILYTVPNGRKVFIVSCKLKHKSGQWVDITSSTVTNKGGIVTVDYYPEYRKQALGDIVVVAEKYSLENEDKVYQNKGDIVMYIENGSSDLRDFHDYIDKNHWIQAKIVYLCT